MWRWRLTDNVLLDSRTAATFTAPHMLGRHSVTLTAVFHAVVDGARLGANARSVVLLRCCRWPWSFAYLYWFTCWCLQPRPHHPLIPFPQSFVYTPLASGFVTIMKLSLFSYLALALPLAAAFPSGSQASCNVRGFDKGNPTAYFYSTKKKYRSNAACGARCAADSECQSYAFGDDTCLGYTSTVYVALLLFQNGYQC